MYEQYLPSWSSGQDLSQNLDEFWSDYWDYSSTNDLFREINQSDYKPIIDNNLLKGGVVLEGGCGVAQWVLYLEHKGFNVHGLDISERTLKKVKGIHPSLNVHAGNIIQLPYPNEFFDLYISLGVIEHLRYQMKDAAVEAGRVLKPTGKLLVSVPYLNIFKKIISMPYPKIIFDKNVGSKEYEFYQYVLKKDEFMQFLNSIGFEVVSWHFCGRSIGLEFLFPYLLDLEKIEREHRSTRVKSNRSFLSLVKRAYKSTLRLLPHSMSANMIMAVCQKVKQ